MKRNCATPKTTRKSTSRSSTTWQHCCRVGVLLLALAMLLPGAVFVGGRRWLGMSWAVALFGALGALAFLLHEQNSIWGGNLLSTLAGEFAYSYGLCFAVLTMIAWLRVVHTGRGWIVAALSNMTRSCELRIRTWW